MNVTTHFMEVLKTFINRKRWSPNTKGRGMEQVSTTIPRPKKEAELCRRRRNPPTRTLVPKASQNLRRERLWFLPDAQLIRDLPAIPRRPLGVHRARATHGLPEAPLPDFPHIPDIPMRDQGDFQRVVVDALRAIWVRVSCTSRRTIRAHSPAEAGRARQRRDPSFEGNDETELTRLTDHMSLIPNMMQNFLSLAIDRHGVDGIDRCARQRACLKEPKLTSNTNLTQLLVLGLGIHGIRFFKQVWKKVREQIQTRSQGLLEEPSIDATTVAPIDCLKGVSNDPPGRTQTLEYLIRERSRSPLEGTLSSVPGTELPSKKWKTSDKENLPYFRIWKSLTQGNRLLDDYTACKAKSPTCIESWRLQENTPASLQSLKEKLDEHSKQLEQSAEKLSQLHSENTVLRDQNQALNATGNKKRRFHTRVRPMGNLNTPNTEKGTTDTPPAPGVAGPAQEGTENPQIHDLEESVSEPEPEKEAPERAAATEPSITAYLEQIFSKRFDAMQSMVERLPGVAPPIQRTNPDSYADTPFVEDIASVEMPRKFSFPSIKMYDGTGDPDDHIAQYKQRIMAVALPKESREATICKGFGSTLIGPALQWYINLPTRSISSFAGLSYKFVEQFASSRSLEKTSDGLYEILQHRVEPLRDYIARFNQEKVVVPECSIPTAISAFKGGLLPDGGLYKELTMYPCKTMEDVLSRAWAQVKWEEDVASRAKAQPKQDQRSAQSNRGGQDERSSQKGSKNSGSRNRGRFQYRPQEKEEGMSVSTWPDISDLSISTPDLVSTLRQMGQQVKWPPMMIAPNSFRNPELWYDFHHDHGHKTEDCIALKIEVNELLQEGHLR
ncbi:hypothetical protein F2Q69_00013519 [Brassica cretica]|uniref:Retrotransposon gag domain-containing protein n=1 Tax=Brassica cretica TaxID=69181 RepID=A0A8S9QW89_BRACR|nr:hypothetical protein F2Q69_00013519 [Brassica cretica]